MADYPDHGPDRDRQYQAQQSGMYELEFPAPQLMSADGEGPVLIHALEGFSDAATPSGWLPVTSRPPWTANWWRPSRSTICSTTAPGGP